ncbi:hypothetical protein OKW48_003965 [Paraburkholderia youngii]|uniref:hypothetical protein n=1 Tax=Paraburkholderia youngii TaxID=2782701 RepID=UPI003D237EA0
MGEKIGAGTSAAARFVGAFRKPLRHLVAATGVLTIQPKFNVAGANCKDKFCRESDMGPDDFAFAGEWRIVCSALSRHFWRVFVCGIKRSRMRGSRSGASNMGPGTAGGARPAVV